MATATRVYVAIVGVVGVGATFLKQLADLSERPGRKSRPVDICVVYISRSTTCLLAGPENPIFLDGKTQSELGSLGRTPLSPEKLADFLPGPSVLVEKASSHKVAGAYHLFLRSRTHVVTPNKKGCSSGIDVASNYGNTVSWAGSLFFGPAGKESQAQMPFSYHLALYYSFFLSRSRFLSYSSFSCYYFSLSLSLTSSYALTLFRSCLLSLALAFAFSHFLNNATGVHS